MVGGGGVVVEVVVAGLGVVEVVGGGLGVGRVVVELVVETVVVDGFKVVVVCLVGHGHVHEVFTGSVTG